MDAYQLVSQVALSPVANVCDTVYTMVCKVPKTGLPQLVGTFGLDQLHRRRSEAV